jgi:hypothetical protein
MFTWRARLESMFGMLPCLLSRVSKEYGISRIIRSFLPIRLNTPVLSHEMRRKVNLHSQLALEDTQLTGLQKICEVSYRNNKNVYVTDISEKKIANLIGLAAFR